MFDKLSEIGAYELYFDGIETYSLHFTDLMRSGEIFQGNHLPSIIETAVKYAHNPKWLNEKIATPKKYITQSKRRPTQLAHRPETGAAKSDSESNSAVSGG